MRCLLFAILIAIFVYVKDGVCMGADDRFLTVQVSTTGEEPWSIDAPVSAKKPFKHAVFGYLVNITDSLIVEPGLLEDWSWDFESKRYIFKVKKGLKFHNGRSVTSQDVEFSLVRWFLMKHQSVEKIYVKNVKGIEAVKQGDVFVSGAVAGIKIIDSQTLAIEVSVYNPTFLHSLIDIPLVPIEALKDDYVTWKSLPVGAGAYKMDDADVEKGIYRLSVATEPDSMISKIELLTKKVPGREVDIANVADNSIKDANPIVISTKHDTVSHILFNYETELGRNENFRKAIRYGMDRKKISALVSKFAQPACEIIPPSFWGSTEYIDYYNPTLAHQYLLKVPKHLLAQEIVVPALREDFRPYLTEIERQLNTLGIKTKFVAGWTKFTTSDASPIRLVEINVSSPDPLLQFSFFMSGTPLLKNYPKDDKEFENLYRQAAVAPSFDVKVKAIAKLSDHMEEEAIAVQTHANPPIFWVNKHSKVDIGNQRSAISFFLDRVRWK